MPRRGSVRNGRPPPAPVARDGVSDARQRRPHEVGQPLDGLGSPGRFPAFEHGPVETRIVEEDLLKDEAQLVLELGIRRDYVEAASEGATHSPVP